MATRLRDQFKVYNPDPQQAPSTHIGFTYSFGSGIHID